MSSVHSDILNSPVLKSLHMKSMALNRDYNNDILCSDNLPTQSDDENNDVYDGNYWSQTCK